MKSQHYWLAWHLYKLLLLYMSLYLRIFIKKKKIPYIFLPPLHSSHSANSFSVTHIYFKKEKHPLIPFLYFYFLLLSLPFIFSGNIGSSKLFVAVVYLVVSDFATPSITAHPASLSFSTSQICSNSYPLIGWCHPIISSSVALFFSCPQYLPTSRSFPMHWLFASGDQSIGVSASVLPMNTQGWFPSGLTGLVSQLSKGLWRDISDSTFQRHQYFSA